MLKDNIKLFLKAGAGLLLFFTLTLGLMKILSNYFRLQSTILTSTECNPPCWYGIRPGETNVAGVRYILYEQEWINPDVIEEITLGDHIDRMQWLFQRPAGDYSGTVYFEDDRVKAVSILTTGSLTLTKAFNRLGQPKLISSNVGWGEDWGEFLEIVMLYPSEGYLVEVDIDLPGGKEINQVELRSSAPVFRITYFDPDQYQQLLKTQILIRWPISTSTNDLQPWPGLGMIYYERNSH